MMKNNDIQQFYNILNVCFMLVKVIVQMLPILENSRDISKLILRSTFGQSFIWALAIFNLELIELLQSV